MPLRILVTDPRLRLARSQTGLNSSSLAGQMSGSAEAPSPRQGVRIGHPQPSSELLRQLLERRSEGYINLEVGHDIYRMMKLHERGESNGAIVREQQNTG